MKIKMSFPILLALVLLLAACTNDNSGKKDSALNDSLNVKDSLAKSPISKEEENKVVGNIEFGISEKQFEQDLAKFKGTLEHNEFQTIYGIGSYMVSSFAGSFNNDSLYKLTMLGDLIPKERYKEELLPQVNELKESMVKTYGQPQSGQGAPDMQHTTKGYSYKAYSWVIGDKTIDIKVANRGIYFSCDLIIYQPKTEQSR